MPDSPALSTRPALRQTRRLKADIKISCEKAGEGWGSTQSGGLPRAAELTPPSPQAPVAGPGDPPGKQQRGAAAAVTQCEAKLYSQTSCFLFPVALLWPPKELELNSTRREAHLLQLLQLTTNRVQFSLLRANV